MSKVIIETTKGDFTIEMFPEKAPNTVKNFLRYVEDSFFDGLVFHRIIDGFMVQGGGFTPEGEHKDGRDSIKNEANNGLSNSVGTLAMARTNDPHSASSQFFINIADNTFLDYQNEGNWGYCVFGKVVEGMDVVNEIKSVKTGTNRTTHMPDWPKTNIIIKRAYLG